MILLVAVIHQVMIVAVETQVDKIHHHKDVCISRTNLEDMRLNIHTCFALASPSSPSEGSSSTGSDNGSSGSESTPGGSPSTSSDTGDTSSHPTLNAGATDNNNASSSTNTGAIAGGVIGGLLGAAVVLLALFWFLKKRRHTNKAAEGAFADKTMVPDDDVEEFTPQSDGYPYGMQQSSRTNANSNDMTPPPPPPHSALYNRSQ